MGNIELPLSLFFFLMLVIAIPSETITGKFIFLTFVSFAPKSHGSGHIIQNIMSCPKRLITGMNTYLYCYLKKRGTKKRNLPEILGWGRIGKFISIEDHQSQSSCLYFLSYRNEYHNDVRGFNIGCHFHFVMQKLTINIFKGKEEIKWKA